MKVKDMQLFLKYLRTHYHNSKRNDNQWCKSYDYPLDALNHLCKCFVFRHQVRLDKVDDAYCHYKYIVHPAVWGDDVRNEVQRCNRIQYGYRNPNPRACVWRNALSSR